MPAIEKLLFPDGEDDHVYNGNDDKTACFAALRADAHPVCTVQPVYSFPEFS